MPDPGWYADPLRRAQLRWYHGAGWGEHVRTGSTEGVDPIDAAGNPLWAAPRWSAPPAAAGGPAGPPPPVRPAAPGPGMGRGTKAALWAVLGVFVVLVAGGVVAVVVLARNVPRLTGGDIERQVGAAMSERYQTEVSLDCPPVFYTGSSDGTLECTATGVGFDTVAYVEVVVRDAKVSDWQIVDTADAGAPADDYA